METRKCARKGCDKTIETHDRRRKYCSDLCAALVAREARLKSAKERQKRLINTLKHVKPYG